MEIAKKNNYQSKSYEYAYSDESSNEEKEKNSESENSFELYEQLQPQNKLLPRTYLQEDSYYTIQNIKYWYALHL